jgi:hypothetical protein
MSQDIASEAPVVLVAARSRAGNTSAAPDPNGPPERVYRRPTWIAHPELHDPALLRRWHVDEGLTITGIAKRLKAHTRDVRRALLRHGVPITPGTHGRRPGVPQNSEARGERLRRCRKCEALVWASRMRDHECETRTLWISTGVDPYAEVR